MCRQPPIKEKGVERILSKDKDFILNKMLENTSDEWFDFSKKNVPELSFNDIQMDMVKRQFVDMGLIQKGPGYGNKIKINLAAHDWANLGGFQMYEDFYLGQLKLLASQLEKLQYEMNKMENLPIAKNILETIGHINDMYAMGGILNDLFNKH